MHICICLLGCGYSQWLYIVLEHSRSLCNLNLNHLIVHTKWLVNMQMMSLYCGLLIVWTLIDIGWWCVQRHCCFFFPLLIFFFQKCSWGSETHAQFFFSGGGGGVWGVWGAPRPHPGGGHVGSENDTLLPMTMICDRFKFWSLAVKSYHPETLAAEEKK